MQKFLKPGQFLLETKYFTSIVTNPPDKNRRQAVFIEALETLQDFRIYYGRYLDKDVKCQRCGANIERHHEKRTDVNIATQMLVDAFQNRFQVALLVTGDSDLVGTIEAIH